MLLIILIMIIAMAFCALLGYKKPGLALIVSPIATILLVLVSGFVEQTEGIIIAPLIFLATLIAVLMSKRDPDSDQIPQRVAKWILIIFVFILFSAIGFALFGHWGSLGLMFVIFFITAVISHGLTSRYATAAYVLSTIGSSMRQNLPLTMALESAASGRTDDRARILRRIKEWLVQGYSLSESIKRGYPKCPSHAVAMIAAAERINQLPLVIKSIEANMVARANDNRRVRPIHPLYPVILITFMFFVVLGLVTFIIPQFKEILTEMFEGAQLPAATRFLMRTVGFITWETGSLLLIALAFIIFVVVPVSIRIKFRPRRPDKPYLLSRVGDFIKWHLPVLHWFEKNYSIVQVVELLRLSLSSGSTVNDAIANTLWLDVNNCFRKRLENWLAKVEAGDDIATSAQKERLGSCLAWVFDKANQGNTLAILETLESFYRSNYSYSVNLARFIMWPCVTIIMGVMVGFVVYAIFSPMVAIINLFAGSVMP